jgi:hypothetical protein
MSRQEVLPPLTRQVTVREESTVSPPAFRSPGPIEAIGVRYRAQRDARVMDSLTVRAQSFRSLVIASTALNESHIEHQRSLAKLDDLPELLENDRTIRRVKNAQLLRQVRHEGEINELYRSSERARANEAVTHAHAALTDAKQQLKAQEMFGFTTHEIAHKRQQYLLLDLEMEAEEKRAILRQQREVPAQTDGDVLQELYRERDKMNSHGLDTDRVNEQIAKLQGR